MTILRVKLPDVQDPSAWMQALETRELEYAILGGGVRVVAKDATFGVALLAHMPRSDTVEVILPARAVALLRVKMPRAKDSVLQRALPNLVEDVLAVDSSTGHYALLPGLHADGRREVAVTDRAWMILAQRVTQACAARHSVCVSEAMLVPEVPFIVVSTHLPARLQQPIVCGFVRHAEGLLPFASDTSTLPTELRLLRSALTTGGGSVALAGAYPEMRNAWSAELGLSFRPSNWGWYNAAPAQASMSLFQREFARRWQQGREWHRTWRWPLYLSAACALVAMIGLNLHWLKLQHEAIALRARMSTDFNTLFPSVSDRGEPLLMAKRQLSLQKTDATFLVLSQALAQAIPHVAPGAQPPVKRLDYRNGILTAELQAGASVATVADRLRSQRAVEVRSEGNVLLISRRGA
jgi:type II secretion system protein L